MSTLVVLGGKKCEESRCHKDGMDVSDKCCPEQIAAGDNNVLTFILPVVLVRDWNE